MTSLVTEILAGLSGPRNNGHGDVKAWATKPVSHHLTVGNGDAIRYLQPKYIPQVGRWPTPMTTDRTQEELHCLDGYVVLTCFRGHTKNIQDRRRNFGWEALHRITIGTTLLRGALHGPSCLNNVSIQFRTNSTIRDWERFGMCAWVLD